MRDQHDAFAKEEERERSVTVSRLSRGRRTRGAREDLSLSLRCWRARGLKSPRSLYPPAWRDDVHVHAAHESMQLLHSHVAM